MLDREALDSKSVSELEALLSTSRAQQEELACELDGFIYNYLDDLQAVFARPKEATIAARTSLNILKERYGVIGQLEDAGVLLSPFLTAHEGLQISREQAEREATIERNLSAITALSAKGDYIAVYDELDSIKTTLDLDHKRGLLSAESVTTLFDRASHEQAALIRHVNEIWNSSLGMSQSSRIMIAKAEDLNRAVDILERLGTLQGKARHMSQKIGEEIVKPCLTEAARLQAFEDGSMQIGDTGQSGLAGIRLLIDFLALRLPAKVSTIVRQHLTPVIVHSIRDDYLPAAIPSELQSRARLEVLAESLNALDRHLKQHHFLATSDVSDLATDIPRLWSEKRRAATLDQCRQIVLSWTGTTETVEQNQNVTQESLLAPVIQEIAVQKTESVQASATEKTEDDEWGASEWDMPEDEPKSSDEAVPEDEGAEAWGLDDDLLSADLDDRSASKTTVVLSTKYTISTIPKSLLQIIDQCKEESRAASIDSDSPMLTKQKTLQSLVASILELYKALVPLLITRTGYPRMTIYNDCIYLASQCDADIRLFGEHYYTLEIHDKIDQIHNVLETTEAFTNATVPTQKETCYAAVQGVLDLLRRTAERYEAQLGRTTLCTALGTLSDAAIVYFVDSVMAMTDISEAESVELAKLGDALSALEDLFRGTDEGDTVLAAMWCPNWFRFRLLLDILEAKLDYILRLWRDGDLVDFEPGEVTELIRALFSDSPKRRNAIDQIMASV